MAIDRLGNDLDEDAATAVAGYLRAVAAELRAYRDAAPTGSGSREKAAQ